MDEEDGEWLTWVDSSGEENRGVIRMRARLCPNPHDSEVICPDCAYFVALAESMETLAVYLIELTFPDGHPEREDSPTVFHMVDPTHRHYGLLIKLFGEYLAQEDSELSENQEEQELSIEPVDTTPPTYFHPQVVSMLPSLPSQLTVYLETMLHAAPAGWVIGPLGAPFPQGTPTVVYVLSAGSCVEIDLGMLECFGADPESHLAMWQSISTTVAAMRDMVTTRWYRLDMTDVPHSYGTSYGFTRMFSVEPTRIGEA